MAQEVPSIRNNPKVTDNGYAYIFDKRSKDGTLRFYRCDKKNDDCPARIHVPVETGDIVLRIHDHNLRASRRGAWPQLNPVTVSLDFEQATLAAIRTAFPEAALLGCLYHLAKNVRLH
ncbi:flywch zinc finger domain-containing protein, partial [Aphelenchoides avenae]